MTIKSAIGAAVALGLTSWLGAGAAIAQTEPYYVTDADAGKGYRIQDGVATSFAIPNFYYALTVRSSLFLQHYDDGCRAEYSLAGVPTGAQLSSTDAVIGEQIDGAATPTASYTVNTYTRQVVSFEPDFSSPEVLFTIPSGIPNGITIDPTTGDFLIIATINEDRIDRYSPAGVLQGSISAGLTGLCCLAL